jgi:hypothetical protein
MDAPTEPLEGFSSAPPGNGDSPDTAARTGECASQLRGGLGGVREILLIPWPAAMAAHTCGRCGADALDDLCADCTAESVLP